MFTPNALPQALRLFLALAFAGAFAASCRRQSSPPAPQTTESSKSAGNVTSTDGEAKAASIPSSGTNKTADPKASAEAKALAKKNADAEKEKARMTAAEQIPVEVAPVTRGPISSSLMFNTTLETEAAVDIYPQTSGQVEALLVEEGQSVAANQPLLQIDDRELRVDVEQTQSNLEHLKLALERIAGLYERNLVKKQEFDDAEYQLNQARLQLERAKLRLSYTTVRAPFAGVITARETQVGARVGSGTKVFSMVKLDEIVARVYVPGRYLSTIADQQPAIITSEFLPNRSFKGWVKRMSPVIDPKSGTFKVTLGVRAEKPTDLPPGLFVNARIITDTRESALLIPKRALVYEGGERFVFTVVNDRAVKRKVVAGYEDPDHVEAISGFEVGNPVVVLGQNGLKDGSSVRTVNPPAAAKAEPPAIATPAKADAPAKTTVSANEPVAKGS